MYILNTKVSSIGFKGSRVRIIYSDQYYYYIKHFANREIILILLICFGSNTRDENNPSQEALVQPVRWPEVMVEESIS